MNVAWDLFPIVRPAKDASYYEAQYIRIPLPFSCIDLYPLDITKINIITKICQSLRMVQLVMFASIVISDVF